MRTSRHPSRSTSRIASLTFGINLGSANARQDQVVVLELGCLHWSRFTRAEVHCWRDVLVAIIDGRQFRQPPLTLPPPPFFPRRACPREDGGGNPSPIFTRQPPFLEESCLPALNSSLPGAGSCAIPSPSPASPTPSFLYQHNPWRQNLGQKLRQFLSVAGLTLRFRAGGLK